MADEILEMPASAEPQVHDLLRRRWSPRAFAQRPVEPTKIRSVLATARWAPSAANQQPGPPSPTTHGFDVTCCAP